MTASDRPTPPAEQPPHHDSNGSNEAEEYEAVGGIGDFVRDHPWITAIMLTCIVAGCIGGGLLLTPEWSLTRRLAAGAFGGAWVGLTLTAIKMIG